MLSELFLDNEKFRIDNEFFQKQYLATYRTIKRMKYTTISEIISCLTDFHANGSYETIAKNFELLDEPDFAYMVRSTDLEAQDFETNVKYVSKHTYDFLSKSKVYGGELLINKIGTPGKTYIMPNLNRPVSLGMNLFLLRIKPNHNINEYFLWAFFNSKFGQNIIKRKVNGTVPLTIDKEAIKSLYVPIIDINIQNLISELILKSQEKLIESKNIYKQAEELLLEAIGLKDFKPNEKGTNIKSFKESFLATGRLDAEYYQVKYEEIIDVVKNFKNGFANFDLFIDGYSTGYPYKSETYINENGIPLVRINNLTKEGLNLSNAIHIPKEDLNLSKKDIAQENDILISMSGTIGLSCVVREKNKVVVNQRIMKITSKNYNPHVLSMLLNSIVGKYQLDRIGTGGVQTNISSNDIKNIIIPIIDYKIQQHISELIEESFYLRGESERLLGEAKDVVEREIGNNNTSK